MDQHRRTALRNLLVLGAAATVNLPAGAQTAGKDYLAIVPPQPGDEPGKIEVIEFFSYGCPHCADFYTVLTPWIAKLPADVSFKKVPITFNRGAWANGARLFYALQAIGELPRLDGDVFKAIHNERINLFDEAVMRDWLSRKGVDAKKFAEAYGAFGVMSQVKRGDQLAGAYKLEGVPALAIGGKYMALPDDFIQKLANADKLIAKVRAERGGKK